MGPSNHTSYIIKHMGAYIDLSIQRRATFPKPRLTSRTAGCLLQSKVGRVDTLRHLQISTNHQKRNLHAPHAAPPLLTGQKILWSSLWTRTGCCWMLGILESCHRDTAPKSEAAHHGKSHQRLICANNLQSFQHSDLESWKPKKKRHSSTIRRYIWQNWEWWMLSKCLQAATETGSARV